MVVTVLESALKMNKYVDHLVRAYKRCGVKVILGADNFYTSNFFPDFLHIQWPESLYRWDVNLPNTDETLARIEERLQRFKSNGSRIVQTVHNLRPHVNPVQFDEDVFGLVARYTDLFVHHGPASIESYKKMYGQSGHARHIQAPHGAFEAMEADFSPGESRQEYGLRTGSYIYLNFGRQRTQKGGSFTRSVFRSWKHPACQLFTIGPLSEEFHTVSSLQANTGKIYYRYVKPRAEEYLSRFSKVERRVDRFVDEEEIGNMMAASDALFLGHRHGLNSGLLALGASYGKALVFPDIGNFREQVRGYPLFETYEAGNRVSAVDALERIQQQIAKKEPGSVKADNTAWVQHHDWNDHVKLILNNMDSHS